MVASNWWTLTSQPGPVKAGHSQVGTPGYMLPGAGIIPWTTADDLFATGIVLYELVTGHHPYPSCLPNAQDSPADPRQYVPDLRPELARLLTRAVSCDPAQHYHSARRFRWDLQDAVAEPEVNYPHAPDGCTPGERAVFNALRRNLTAGYSVWFEPTLFGEKKSARPDFAVLGADVGLVIVEVEEAIITGTHGAGQDTLMAYKMSQFMKQTNLAQQAESHARDLMDEIGRYQDTDPDKYQSLLEKAGKHKGKLAVPISALVAFPNITRTAWQSSELRLYDTSDEKSILLRDDLGNTWLERLRDAAAFHGTLSQAQMDTLRWMLYPEARIPSPPEQALTLDPHQIGIARINTFLPPQAKEIARKPQVRLVRGVVGSGKTLILLLRAKFISEQNPNWRVLVLTYNKSLMKYLRQVFKQIGGDPDRVEIVNFHKWCRDLLPPDKIFKKPFNKGEQKGLIINMRETGTTTFDPQFLVEEFNWIKARLHYKNWGDYPDSQKVKRVGRGRGLGRNEAQKRQEIYDLFCRYNERLLSLKTCDWADVPVMVLKAMDEGFIEKAQYHAILIDEAQDFAPSWFRVAFAMVKPETNMIFIAGDGAQRIYRRDFTWKELGLGITSQNSHVLRRSYRSTREIIDVALEVIRGSPTLIAELRDAGDSLVEPDKEYAEFRHGPLPVLLAFESPEKEYAGVAEEILSLLEQGCLPKDIAILHRHRDGGEKVARELRRRGVAYSVIKDTQDLTVPAVKICTFHSAKGLEFEVVFVCGLEDFKVDEPVDTQSEEFQQLLDQDRKLLYVGMTRARQMLCITYSGEGPEWIMGRLQHKLTEMISCSRPGPQTLVGEAERQYSPDTLVDQAFRECWEGRLTDLGQYNILVEGLTDKIYLELAAERYQEVHGVDLLDGGLVRVVAGRGTKRMGPEFGVLQSLEVKGIRFVVILDGDDAGRMAAEAMHRFGAQKNRHFFQLERKEYKDKGGKSWDVEIEDMLPQLLIKAFVHQHPDAIEERFQRREVVKFVISGKPVERDGQTHDYKMMLAEHVRRHATLDDLMSLVELLQKARKCMRLD